MTNPIWTPDSLLFLAVIAIAIAFLLFGEFVEARRPTLLPARAAADRFDGRRLRALPKAARAALLRKAAALRSHALD